MGEPPSRPETSLHPKSTWTVPIEQTSIRRFSINFKRLFHLIQKMFLPPFFVLNDYSSQLFQCNPGCFFDIEDPLLQRTPREYSPLHDPNLKQFFKVRPNLIKTLEKHGLINECGSVRCTISEFNKYRDYLARLHTKTINDEREKWDQLFDEDFRQVQRIRLTASREASRSREDETRRRIGQTRARKERM
jgi:hypothetical protein